MTTRYAKLGDAHIAYRVFGDSSPDILYLLGEYIPVDQLEDEPRMAHVHRRLAAMGRMIVFNRRGVGLSDPADSDPTLEQHVDDTLAVLDEVRSDKAFIVAANVAGPAAIRFAAMYPQRCAGLILINTYARITEAPGYIGLPESFVSATADQATDTSGDFNALQLFAPSVADDQRFRDWWEAAGHRGASPARSRKLWQQLVTSDERETLAGISTPTLCIWRRELALTDVCRYVAENIAGARGVEVEGADLIWWVGDADEICDEIESFIGGRDVAPRGHRKLATVLFVDLVSSTEQAVTLGDRRWTDRLATYQQITRQQIERGGGVVVNTAGDGLVATFDMPVDAVKTARRIAEGVRALDLHIRAGVHTGEIELLGEDVAGIGVHIAARVMSAAPPGEIWVSRTVADLVTGSGLTFEDRGEHDLKGVPGRWTLLALV
jgi:class 3 adenylate cyclase